MLLVDDTQTQSQVRLMYGIPRVWGGTRRGLSCITDQITDQYAPYCSELGYAVSSEYRELTDCWWIQKAMNTLSVRQIYQLSS